MTSSLLTQTRLEKAATDNGFDRALAPEGDWLVFASTQCPLRVWLRALGDGFLITALSMKNVLAALDVGTPIVNPLPEGAAGARSVGDFSLFHRLLRRAFQLSKTLPNELLHTFEKEVAALSKTTEVERLVVQRVGQGLFRAGLLDLWEGRCVVTGLAAPALLRASHIKPWADCESDAERLDVYNGLLLAPHLDAAFDQGFITVADDGAIVVSDALGADARAVLGLDRPLRVHGITAAHRDYLPWHRERVFRSGAVPLDPSFGE